MAYTLSVLAAAMPAAAPGQETPVRIDLRAGAVYSSVLAEGSVLLLEDAGTDNLHAVDLQPDVGFAADAGVLLGFSDQVDGEVRIGVARQGLRGQGPGGSADAGGLTTVSAVAGLGVHLWPRIVVRGGFGKLFYSSRASAFESGSSTGLLLTGGVGYELPVDLSFSLRVDADAQWHGFGTTTLREAGAADGSAYELALKLAATFGSDG